MWNSTSALKALCRLCPNPPRLAQARRVQRTVLVKKSLLAVPPPFSPASLATAIGNIQDGAGDVNQIRQRFQIVKNLQVTADAYL